ncbi:hypothetical protein LCGC14_0620000 [marine sediment metagenome]|uniref:Uncharacterized protein n=1 Tax=marine sediment metagenome TaxID=412755 RepID=A0A0F9UDK7_9ZZZZ
MGKAIEGQGAYKAPDGTNVSFTYEYTQYDSIADAIAEIGEIKALKDLQRMIKLDASNPARESAKVANGHSTRISLTEEQKADAKSKRLADKSLLEVLKAKGISLEQLQSM